MEETRVGLNKIYPVLSANSAVVCFEGRVAYAHKEKTRLGLDWLVLTSQKSPKIKVITKFHENSQIVHLLPFSYVTIRNYG